MEPLTLIAIAYWIKWSMLTLVIAVVVIVSIVVSLFLGKVYQCQHVPEKVEYLRKGVTIIGERCIRCQQHLIHTPMFTQRCSDDPPTE